MPSVLDDLAGRINDIDSHEMTPARFWAEEFGEVTAPYASVFIEKQPPNAPNSLNADVVADDAPIEALISDEAWQAGSWAPGSWDMRRRLDVMDRLGVRQTMIFGTGPLLIGTMLASAPGDVVHKLLGIPTDFDARAAGQELCKAHNDWCIKVASIDPRLRPVAVLLTESIDEACVETQRVIDAGVRAVMIPCGVAPGGLSPAHPDMDRFWELCSRTNTPVISHVGGEFGFLRTQDWLNAPVFAPNLDVPSELALDPYSTSVLHLASLNYLSNMILGGVFERHPNLRFGVIEQSAHWVAPMAEYLDVNAEQWTRRLEGVISMKPSEYLRRNVRVSAFWYEPVDRYIERSGLVEVFCYGSDYPHYEGGRDPRQIFADKLERLGPDVVERFFVTNAQLLMP